MMMLLTKLMTITKSYCGVSALACNVTKLFELLVAISQAYWPWTLIWHAAATSVITNLIA